MTDLTKIKTAFSLLDEEAQSELRAHKGPFEWFDGARWLESSVPPDFGANAFVWRVKPQPPKPREWWINLYSDAPSAVAWHSREAADQAAASDRVECIRVREVLE